MTVYHSGSIKRWQYKIKTIKCFSLTLMTTLSQKSWSCGMGSKCVTPVYWVWGFVPSSSWLLSFGSDL